MLTLEGGRRRFVTILLAIAAVALVGRIVYVLTVTNNETKTKFYDAFFYINETRTLAEGRGFVGPLLSDRANADHPPLTVVTLAPVSYFTDGDELAMRLTMAALGTGVVVLVGLIGVEVAGGRAGLIGAGVAAVYPNLWMNDGLVMAETLATLAAAAAIFCCYRLARAPTWRNAIGAGVACGLAMLARGELALLIPLVVVPTILALRWLGRRQRWTLVGLSVAGALVLVAPWVGYNLARFEHRTLLSTGDGGTLLGANCHQVYFGDRVGEWDIRCLRERRIGRDTSFDSARQRGVAFRYVRRHLDRFPLVMLARVGRVWSVYAPFQMAYGAENEGRPAAASFAGLAMFWLLAPLAVGGLITLRRRGVLVIPLAGTLVMVTVIAALFYGLVRFRIAADVAVVVLAAVAIDALMPWLGRKIRPQSTAQPAPPTVRAVEQSPPLGYGAGTPTGPSCSATASAARWPLPDGSVARDGWSTMTRLRPSILAW